MNYVCEEAFCRYWNRKIFNSVQDTIFSESNLGQPIETLWQCQEKIYPHDDAAF